MKLIAAELLSILLVVVFAVLLTPLARSTTLAQLSLQQLAASAHFVVRVLCLSNESLWREGEIWTITSFRVRENWKGNSPREIQVWMIGGSIGHITSYIPGAPRFLAGEEAVLFLEPTRDGSLSVTAWGEGTFRIRRDANNGEAVVTQDTALAPDFDPATHAFRAAGIRELPLARFKSRVLAAEKSQRCTQ
ncbi:MAG TPA: hypothetical protein VGR81_14035 [Candidatus Acidoferrales bacterium]|nr:hypothetical protein [Candidatus Acidoferrales bacterium]